MNRERRTFLHLATQILAGTQLGSLASAASRLPVEGRFPTFEGATGWINSQPLTRADVRGKVLLVDFCTYTCINWRRTLPYLRAWADKYKGNKFLLVGVHTPEFPFEKDLENVRRSVASLHIDYPIAVDSNYAIWQAFHNEYWPALYFVDAKGQIRAHQFGEGAYDRSETWTEALLTEAGDESFNRGVTPVDAAGAEAAADWDNLRSAENYLGYERTENFSSAGGFKRHKASTYNVPERLQLNHWALHGEWLASQDRVTLTGPNGVIAYQFHSRDLHLVMGPGTQRTPVPFRILVNGAPPGPAHGVDVDDSGQGAVVEPRMYNLIRQQQPVLDRRFEIQFLGHGVEAFSFTFG